MMVVIGPHRVGSVILPLSTTSSPERILSRRGVVKLGDPLCPTLTGPGGELYFLVGNTRKSLNAQ